MSGDEPIRPRRKSEVFGGLVIAASGVIYTLACAAAGGLCAQIVGPGGWGVFGVLMLPGLVTTAVGLWMAFRRPAARRD